jgi:hypothetical protein
MELWDDWAGAQYGLHDAPPMPGRARMQDFVLVGVQYADSQGGCTRGKALFCLHSPILQLCLGAPEAALSM